jgi:hypothetical protein
MDVNLKSQTPLSQEQTLILSWKRQIYSNVDDLGFFGLLPISNIRVLIKLKVNAVDSIFLTLINFTGTSWKSLSFLTVSPSGVPLHKYVVKISYFYFNKIVSKSDNKNNI